ncbi:MAG: hypothetical protein R3C56_26475 [Pirellulaceae bacterium]
MSDCAKCIVLAEELSLRSRRVTPNMKALEQMADRMDSLRSRMAEIEHDELLRSEYDACVESCAS